MELRREIKVQGTDLRINVNGLMKLLEVVILPKKSREKRTEHPSSLGTEDNRGSRK